jgi:hypothetical protein
VANPLWPVRWARGLRHGSVAVRLLRMRFRIPPEARMSVSLDCCVLLGKVLCDGPITHPEDSYRVCVCVCVCVRVRVRACVTKCDQAQN